MKDAEPWWRRELGILEAGMRRHLRRKLPALRNDHEDLVNDALEGLLRYVESSAHAPSSWLAVDSPPLEDQLRYRRLAYTILDRRITDTFRKRLPELEDPQLVEQRVGEDGGDSAHRGIHLLRVLEVCIRIAGALSAQERELLQEVALGAETPLTPTERQRLKRLRAKLGKALEERLGASVKDLLREEP